MSLLKKIIIAANTASIEEHRRDLHEWAEFMNDAGINVTVVEHVVEKTHVYELQVLLQTFNFKFSVIKAFNSCSFKLGTISYETDTFRTVMEDGKLVFLDMSLNPAEDFDRELYNTANTIIKRVRMEL